MTGSITSETAVPAYEVVDSNQHQHSDVNPGNDESSPILNFDLNLKSSPNPTSHQCIAHLKLLEVFYLLRCEVANCDDLFGISNSMAEKFTGDAKNQAMAKLCEKRWAIYLVRAEDRFRKWWENCVPRDEPMITQKRVMSDPIGFSDMSYRGDIQFTVDNLPPIDILMVWHSYMLNPRNYLEDCLRNGMRKVWATGMPWKAVNECIDKDFKYNTNSIGKETFQSLTGLEWDNLHDAPVKQLSCPGCNIQLQIPWTNGVLGTDLSKPFQFSTGYGDKAFESICPSCNLVINHEALRVQKFRKDVQLLIKDDIPMPGTLLNRDGKPVSNFPSGSTYKDFFFPNQLILSQMSAFIEITDPNNRVARQNQTQAKMTSIRQLIEICLRDKRFIRQAASSSNALGLLNGRISIRRMMARYWENSSPLSLDLVGAVIRQGTFVEKMHNIDWLHSPAVHSTMDQLLIKYQRFMEIIAANPSRVAVPTLDVDLAWHTHQLSPFSYYNYTDKVTRKFIDHDDKIDETKLSDSFEWTCKTYQRLYKEPYSSCMCWYCEAIRETHRSIFHSKSDAKIDDQLFNHDNLPTDPNKGPHISAHNAVQIIASEAVKGAHVRRKTAKIKQLEKAYDSASKRAKKKGRNLPDRYSSDPYLYSYYWGYPMILPFGYAPFMGAPFIGGEYLYPGNPACMSAGIGAAGNCAAGTCGGNVAQGGCAGVSGACAGGGNLSMSNGGCAGGAGIGGCGGGSGGCGGGGGGGCGGGGGN